MDHFFFFKRKKEAQRVTQNSAVWTLRSLNLKWTNFFLIRPIIQLCACGHSVQILDQFCGLNM